MAIDWDSAVLGPVMAVFGEGSPGDPSSYPIYYPAAGGAITLPDAVFDEQYQLVTELADGSQEANSQPILGVRASLFRFPPQQGDGVRIPRNGKTYRVVNPQPDGHGHILLILMETAL